MLSGAQLRKCIIWLLVGAHILNSLINTMSLIAELCSVSNTESVR